MLRASKVVRASGSRLSVSPWVQAAQTRAVSTQLVRNPAPKRKPATNTSSKQQKNAKWGTRKPMAAGKDEKTVSSRGKTKFGKLAAKLAEMKNAQKAKQLQDGPGGPSVDPVTPEQRQLLDLIQGPLVTAQDFKSAHKNFLTNSLRRSTPEQVSAEGASMIEKGVFDGIAGRYVTRSQFEDLASLDEAQKQLIPSPDGEVPLTFNDRGKTLRSAITQFFETRQLGRQGAFKPRTVQQINMPVRFQSHKNLLLKVLEEEAQFLIEQEKIYLARLESLKSLSEDRDKLSEEDLARYKEIQETHTASAQTEISKVLAEVGHIVASDNFNTLMKPAILQHILTDGSETVHVMNLKDPSGRPFRLRYAKFLERNGGKLALPVAAVANKDEKRVIIW